MILSKQQLLELLDDIRKHIISGDSFEGSIQYLIPESPKNYPNFEVKAVYRINNLHGQGGIRLIQ
jgi:hypothetical protein